MQKIFLLLAAMAFLQSATAQHTITLLVKNEQTKEPLAGATVKANKTTVLTNTDGIASLKNLPAGQYLIIISHSGFGTVQNSYSLPLPNADTVTILLQPQEEEMDEVIVQTTRTSRTIQNTPTRVETIDGEELDEKNNMRPANVSMLLHESTGMQVQQTSATNGNASIRIQGLDGRYTQLLKDGYPNFGNFASGLSVLEIPPLDLKQVEVIKGPASTLYGGGAIAGVVNFISKQPGEQLEGDFIFNQSNIGQKNIGGYISKKKNKFGFSFLTLANFQKPYDVDKDDFSELPESRNVTINPRVFYYINPSTTVMLGNSFTKGSNNGGDMQVIDGKANAEHTYFEKNETLRNTTTLEIDKKLQGNNAIKIKQSLAVFKRDIAIPGYSFGGTSTNSFTDASLLFLKKQHTVISGINIIADNFRQKNTAQQKIKTFTAGAYVQHTWDAASNIKIESGLRADNVQYKNAGYKNRQTFLLPRVSALFKLAHNITSRIGGGLGYKTPTIFTEETERMQYQAILPLTNVTAEKSAGLTADVNYKTTVGEDLSVSINQLFFYTQINKPLVLQKNSGGNYFTNAAKPVTSSGFETNVKFIFKHDLKLFAGYTFTNAKATYLTANQFLPLLPKSKLNLTLMYEKEDNFKLGLEGYFTGQQYLYNGFKTPSFWEFGFMAQKTFGKISGYINFENFTDQRQSNYKTVANPPHNNPVFDDIWNHTEGFVVNGGIKLKL
jgi:iron complex outermembrane receptor protein/outer membrane receptor for ferrienterochelin and colicins